MQQETSNSHEETRERILSAAEELFALKGYEATSVRDITTKAQCNIAAVNYHFGAKEKLYTETAHRLVSRLRDEKISRLQKELEEKPETDLEGFISSFAGGFVDPVEKNSRSRFFLLFFTREMLDPHLPPKLFFSEFIEPLMRFAAPVLMRLAPSLTEDHAILCMMSLVGQLHHRLKLRQFMPATKGSFPSMDFEGYVEHVVRFSAAGIRACAQSGEKA